MQIETCTLEEAINDYDPIELKNMALKGIIDLDEDEPVDLQVIKDIITKHLYPRIN